MAFHHVTTAASIFLALYGGYGLGGISNALLLMECSTIPLNFRWLYRKEQLGTWMPTML